MLAADAIIAEYVAVIDPDSFEPVATVAARTLIALAARVGPVRLIDNLEVAP